MLHGFKALQDEEALGIRQERDGDGGVRTFLYLRDVESNVAIENTLDLFTSVLRLREGPGDVEVVFGPYFRDGNTISMQTMSVMDILTENSAYIVAPEEHVSEGRTRPNRTFDPADELTRPSLRIFSSEDKPKDAMAAVPSRGYWYYIDDRDIDSKKAFSFLMILMQLSAAQDETRGPVVTIGTGG